MATFENAIPIVLKNEGGYVNNPLDSGGSTKYGISTRFLLSHPEIGVTDAKDLTLPQAVGIYEKYWWNFYHYDNIIDDTIACKLFDLCVNMGIIIHKITQTVINTDFWGHLIVDGNLGQQSFNAINAINTLSTQQTLINAISDGAWQHYQAIIQANPKDAVFAAGWKARAYNISKAGSVT